jgi:EpsI family protein
MNHPAAWIRFLCLWLVLLCTALLLVARSSVEHVPEHQALDAFPYRIGNLQGKNVPIDQSVSDILGPGQFLDRQFSSPLLAEPPVELFVAYYPSQRTGDTIHSPQNCLPGSGWTPLQTGLIQIPATDGRTITANRYIVGKGMDRILVLYWYQAHGRTTPSEYWAKIHLVTDAIKLNRTDGALVRIAVPIPNSADLSQIEARAVQFAQPVLQQLDAFIPR